MEGVVQALQVTETTGRHWFVVRLADAHQQDALVRCNPVSVWMSQQWNKIESATVNARLL